MSHDYSKYYTPLPVADALVSLITMPNHSKVIDICCGSCNLLSTAMQYNPQIDCVGVDVSLVDSSKFDVLHEDGRTYAMNHQQEYDFALANPPFGSSGKDSFSEILFVGAYKRITSSRLEIEMLVANLMLLKEKGVLLIILPSTFVDGASMINVRRVIAANHHIRAIIEMPLNAFQPHRIKCRAIIIEKRKNCQGETTQIYNMDNKFELNKLSEIKQIDVLNGHWSSNNSTSKPTFAICQGTISSQMFSDSGVEILHTGKYAVDWKPSIRYMNTLEQDKKMVFANKGDILISRVGASAGQKMVYEGAPTLISDCLLIVKNLTESERTNIMQMDLRKLVKGLSAPHVTATDIYKWYSLQYMV